MKAFSPVIKNSYRRLTLPSPVPVRFFAQNKGGAPPKGGNFPQQGKPNQKPQHQQQQPPKQPFQQQKPQQPQQNQPKQQQQQGQQPSQPKSNVPAQQAAAATTPATLSPEVVKKDLLTLFAKEVEEIKKDEGKTALANEIKKYLDQSGFKVDETEDGAFVLKKADKNYSIEVIFEQSPKEQGENYGEEDFGNEDDVEKDFNEDAEEEDEDKERVNYSAQIYILDKATQAPKGTLAAEGFVGGDGRLYVESVVISDSIAKEEKPSEASLLDLERGPVGPALEFQNLPQNTQDKLYDFFDSLGIDDQMAQFMKVYTQEYIHVKNEIEFYEKFRKLLS